ncbi:hypothetical protein HDU97_004833 [Phlyctochytrium planicorne]|nr:hypothetical protein HDU97_004833 [Phlyctochytrium planicorne]
MSTSKRLAKAFEALHSMYAENVASRMKSLEGVDQKVDPSQPYIVRLDGVSFSTFTNGLVKPFDWRLKEALVKTTEDLMMKFVPVTGFHISDEISLVFPASSPPPTTDTTEPKFSSKATRTEPTHMYTGRVQKIASVTASYAAARLNFHLLSYDWDDLHPLVQERIKRCEAHFDGRVIPVPSMHEAMECLFWRSNLDGFRNAVSSIAQANYLPKELHKKSLRDMVSMLAQKGITFDDNDGTVQDKYLFGTFVKKEEYRVQGFVDPRTGEFKDEEIVRRRLRRGSFNFAEFEESVRTEFVQSKYWEESLGFPRKDPVEGGKK